MIHTDLFHSYIFLTDYLILLAPSFFFPKMLKKQEMVNFLLKVKQIQGSKNNLSFPLLLARNATAVQHSGTSLPGLHTRPWAFVCRMQNPGLDLLLIPSNKPRWAANATITPFLPFFPSDFICRQKKVQLNVPQSSGSLIWLHITITYGTPPFPSPTLDQ